MQLPKLAIKNYQFVLIIIALGFFIGLSSLFNMPRNEDPNPEFPFYTVVAIYPGTSPEDMEELIVDPLEDAIDLVDDVDEIETKIEEGVAVITVRAEFGIDTDDKYDEVLRAVRDTETSLPELFLLDVTKFEPNSRVKILQLALGSASRSFGELADFAEELETKLERVQGVDEVDIDANPEEIIKVTIDFERLAAFNIPLGAVAQTLQGENLNIPSGDLAAGNRSFSIQSSGSYASIQEIRNAVISYADGQMVHLSDVADVRFDYADDNWIARVNGDRALLLSLTQESGNNIVRVGEAINQVVEDYSQKLPEDVFLKTVFEQAPAVKARINDFLSNLMQGVILVGIVVFIFLGFRSSIIIMTVIPLSIIMAIGILDIQGYALEQISIAGLVIALGLLVDNGIVVVENIKRFIAMGYSAKEAAIKGTSEVGFAIISSTATTLLAFFPLANLESGAGEFLRTLPLTVIFALSVSLILALTFTPLVAAKLLKPRTKPQPRWFDRQLTGFIDKFYSPVLSASLRRGWVVMVIGFSLLIGSIMLFPSVGVSFFPTADKPMLLVEIDAPRGSSMLRTDKAVTYVSQILDTTAFVKDYTTNTGHGNPMIYYNRPNENFKKYYAQVLINFQEWNPTEFYKVLDQLRYQFALYPDAKITFNELKNGPPFEAPIEIKIIGDDLEVLKAKSFELEEIIATTEGTLDVDNPFRIGKMDLEVRVNRDKAGLAGVSLAAIDQVLRTGVDGLSIDNVSINQDDYELIIQTDYDESKITSLKKLFVSNQLGEQVPLSQLAEISFVSGIAEILHFNKDRSTAVTANVKVPDAVTGITEEIIARFDEIELPEGYEFFVAGEYEGQQNSFGDLGQLLLVALFGIFAVLVLQFRSFKQPMIVFAAIPLAVTGSFVALFLTGWSFSFFAFVGFNSLIGIVVNNSIILVDYTNQLIRSGIEKKEAIITASKTRFTPILLTSATTILGLVPLTFQATNLWSPLGWTIIGGMISSTFLTLLVVPVLYNWFTTESSFVEEEIEKQAIVAA